MLSRIADAILWMSRYIERAEHAARVVDVNLNLMLDLGLPERGGSQRFWEMLISVPEERALFCRLYDQANERTVSEFLTFRTDNPNSVVSTISRARENARTIRESISSEMWEQLNRAYWHVCSDAARQHWQDEPHTFYQQVKEASQAFQGVTDATMLRGEEWQFVQLGKYLERADNTSRILDIKYSALQGGMSGWNERIDAAQWTALLKSCSAFEAYRRFYVARVEPRRVVEFLVFSDLFPRSIRFSVMSAAQALVEIGSGINSPEAKRAERLLGQLRSSLEYESLDDVEPVGLHSYLDSLQMRLNRVTEELYSAYLIFEPAFAGGSQSAAQQQEQQ
jgi:uncharacterized alpha-E superfamily protein